MEDVGHPPSMGLAPGRQSCWQHWEGLGENREMGMGKRRGKGERKEDFYMGIGKKAIKDSRGLMGDGPS